ncbi:hypothetical protein [Ornithinibacillus halotolerans]|uniref:Uncharacterized protein n=1 Tax=Ornithinibacillus halotolerans TaxID=1274357 RepID=A0A916RVX7_9BACI|nr:hypothetical protein [Ornithinibacillus halotolerans]GGA72606.1 hypothetical protein GCM10008025_15500 [Ornithinibacillus halotolerans]
MTKKDRLTSRKKKKAQDTSNDDRHNENARVSALYHPSYPRIDTENL